MNMTLPVIVNSAIMYPDGEVVSARRHWQVIKIQAILGKESKVGTVQGFVDNTGTFYTREEARELAEKNGQLPEGHQGILYSEDLWPEPLGMIE